MLEHLSNKGVRMSTTRKLIGARIKELRRQAGLTQEALAERVGLDSRHLSRLEVGRHFPSLQTLELIANALNVQLVELFQFPGELTACWPDLRAESVLYSMKPSHTFRPKRPSSPDFPCVRE